MPILDATVSGANSTSYVTRTEANAYFAARLRSTEWDAAPDAVDGDRDKALIMATSMLDRLPWIGAMTVSTQRLQWPRSYVPKPYDPNIQYAPSAMIEGDAAGYWPANAVPRPIQEATFELALELLRASSDPAGEDLARQIVSESVGPISTTYAQPGDRPSGLARYPEVWRSIARYLMTSRQQRVVRS